MSLTIEGRAMYVVRRLDIDVAKDAIVKRLRKCCDAVEIDRTGDIVWRAKGIRKILLFSRLRGTSGSMRIKPKSYGGASINFNIDISLRTGVSSGIVVGLVVLGTTADKLSLPLVIGLAFIAAFGLVNEMRRLKIWLRDEIEKALKELDPHAVVV